MFAVHMNLLTHFSPYYRSVLEGRWLEAEPIYLETTASAGVVEHFVSWLYMNNLANRSGHYSGVSLSKLYVFANMTDIIALRRDIMTVFFNDPTILKSGPTNILFSNLPDTSPIRKWMLQSYICHWCPDGEVAGADSEAVLRRHCDVSREFLMAVIAEQHKMEINHKIAEGHKFFDELDDGEAEQGLLICACCDDVCEYHEHKGEAERLFSKRNPLCIVILANLA